MAAIVVSAAFGGCGEGSGIQGLSQLPVTVASVTLSPDRDTVFLDDSLRMTASATRDDGTRVDEARSFEWRSSNSAVVRVESDGLIRGRTLGNALVSAALGGLADTSLISVIVGPGQTP